MNPTLRARRSEIALSPRLATSAPSSMTEPAVGLSMHPMRLSSVVLPLPEGPTIMAKDFARISRLMPFRAGTSMSATRYVLTTLSNLATGVEVVSAIRVDTHRSIIERTPDGLVGLAIQTERRLRELRRARDPLGIVGE